MSGKSKKSKNRRSAPLSASEARSMEDIAKLFGSLRFAKRIVGGVEERDVWKKLDEIQAAYRKVYEAQHERDLALIEERDRTIRELSASLQKIKQVCSDSAGGVDAEDVSESSETFSETSLRADRSKRRNADGGDRCIGRNVFTGADGRERHFTEDSTADDFMFDWLGDNDFDT